MRIENWLAERDNGESAMQRLFNRFDGMYPNLWSKNFASPTNIENWREAWAEAFTEERITFDEVMSGIRACRKSHQFPPTLPEFLQLCREPIDYDKAFFEAVAQMGIRRRPSVRLVDGAIVQCYGKDTWSNPAVYWAAIAMGRDLDQNYKFVRSRWHYELDRVLVSEVQSVPMNTNLIATSSWSKELSAEEYANVESILKNVKSMFEDVPVVAEKGASVENAKAQLDKANKLLAMNGNG